MRDREIDWVRKFSFAYCRPLTGHGVFLSTSRGHSNKIKTNANKIKTNANSTTPIVQRHDAKQEWKPRLTVSGVGSCSLGFSTAVARAPAFFGADFAVSFEAAAPAAAVLGRLSAADEEAADEDAGAAVCSAMARGM